MGGASWGQASWGAHESGARAREGLRKWEGAHGTRAVQPRQRIMGGHHSGGGELVEGHNIIGNLAHCLNARAVSQRMAGWWCEMGGKQAGRRVPGSGHGR
jgi:hypothetical protein